MIIARICSVSERTVRDWRREKFLADFDSLKKILNKTNLEIPKNIEIKDPFWYVHKGAKIGGKLGAEACFKKYGYYGGNPEYRKKKWYEWWERKGKYEKNFLFREKDIQKPQKSIDLAEFVGIVLGDGCITKYQITFTLHSVDDKKYGEFIIKLIKKLFNISVGVCSDKSALANRYYISRTKLVNFCIKELGLKMGNKIKQQVDIPNWIKANEFYARACVRGLVDTDGCIFNHKYKVKGKQYDYKKLSFTSYSKPLRESFFKILKQNGLNPRIAQDRDVRIDSIIDMKNYFKIFNSNNSKHLNKYYK